jgi:benzoyl-CoA reductase subunit C
MEEILSKFLDVVADPYASVSQFKAQRQRKVVGCFPMHLPEELVHAAGFDPVIFWRSNEPVTQGHAHVYSFNCGITRSIVDDSAKGKLSFMDGMIFYDICLQGRELPFVIGRIAPPPYLEITYLPGPIREPVFKSFAIENFRKLKSGLEKFSGQSISEGVLTESIELYNRNRKLIREIYDFRRENPGSLSAKEMATIVQSSMLMPKDEHNVMLEELIADLRKRKPASDGKPRVVLVGCMCQAPRHDVLDLIEEAGAVVVDDDLYVGSRYLYHEVEVNGDPIEALAERYIQRTPPCPTKVDWETDWSEYVIDIVRRENAQGVITLLVKFCPPHLCYYPDVKRKLAEAGIPEVLIEVEHEIVSLEPVRTRLAAFIEEMGLK